MHHVRKMIHISSPENVYSSFITKQPKIFHVFAVFSNRFLLFTSRTGGFLDDPLGGTSWKMSHWAAWRGNLETYDCWKRQVSFGRIWMCTFNTAHQHFIYNIIFNVTKQCWQCFFWAYQWQNEWLVVIVDSLDVSSLSFWSCPIVFWKLVEWNLQILKSRVLTCVGTVIWSNRGPSVLQPVNEQLEIEYHNISYIYRKRESTKLVYGPWCLMVAYKYCIGHSWYRAFFVDVLDWPDPI